MTRYSVTLVLLFTILGTVYGQTTCQCREQVGTCNPLISQGDGRCITQPQPCNGCVCDSGGTFSCEVVEGFSFRFSEGPFPDSCALTPIEVAQCPDVIPTKSRQACCWSWSNDDIYQNECRFVNPGFTITNIVYGIENMSQTYDNTFRGQSTQTQVTITVTYELRGSVVNLFQNALAFLSNAIYIQTQTFPYTPGQIPQTFTISSTTVPTEVRAITATGAALNFFQGATPTQQYTNTLSIEENLQLRNGSASATSTCMYVEYTGTN